jgi:hypothetical protein
MSSTIEKVKKYLTVPQLAERHPAFSASAIRHLIFDAKRNGFDSVISRVGKKLVLEESAFENWVIEQQKSRGWQ